MKRYALIAGCWVMAFASFVQAQETVENGLDKTLSSLKESVGRLNQENRSLAAQNEALQLKRKPLDQELQSLKEEEARIAAQYQALDARYRKKMAEVSGLDAQVCAEKDAALAMKNNISAAGETLSARAAEEALMVSRADTLTAEIADIKAGFIREQDRSAELNALRADQAMLQKDLDQAMADLERAKADWQEMSAAINGGPDQVKTLTAQQADLQRTIEARQAEVASLEERLAQERQKTDKASMGDTSPAALDALAKDVEDLGAKADGVDKETAAQEKALASTARKVSAATIAKRKRDEQRLQDLTAQGQSLKAELTELRKKMVAMDKKKAQLEKELDKSPY